MRQNSKTLTKRAHISLHVRRGGFYVIYIYRREKGWFFQNDS